MTSSKHNDVLYNAAIAGISAGCLDGKDFTQVSATSLATPAGVAQQAAIVAAASELDSLVAFDSTLSVSNSDGTLLVTAFNAGAASVCMPVLAKPLLMYALCKSAFKGQNPQSGTASSYSTIIAGIAAQYAVSVADLLTA
jgi:hypothetical protein